MVVKFIGKVSQKLNVLGILKKAAGTVGAEGRREKLAGNYCPPLIEDHEILKIWHCTQWRMIISLDGYF